MSTPPPLAPARTQAAVVRALVDQLECASNGEVEEWLRAQLIEELARLGCHIVELTVTMTAACPPDALETSQSSYKGSCRSTSM